MAIAAPPAVALTTTLATLHTVPASVRQIVEVVAVNVNASTLATLTLNWTDANAANVSAPLVFTDVAAKDTVISPRKTLEAGDKITGLASANGFITASVNVVYEEPSA